jgi:hypothetical protein
MKIFARRGGRAGRVAGALVLGTVVAVSASAAAPASASAAAEVDTAAPTAPGAVRALPGYGFALQWDPSTDDRGVVAYEVFDGGRLRATVTRTSYVVSACCPPPPVVLVYAVRALDAAGNRSPFSFHPMAVGGSAAPVTPGNLRVAGIDVGILHLRWDDPALEGMRATAVAGYEVSLDGVPVGAVSGGDFRMPTPRPGCHTVLVRTFNAAGVRSAPASIRVRTTG